MAELAASSSGSTTYRQLLAIAWLRWRILANGFRRKGGAAELITRILMLPLFAALALFPTAAAGGASWLFTHEHQLPNIAWILWAAFGLTQLLNINIGQPGTTFDPNELLRFPMPLGRFVLVRLCFGLLSPGNLVVSLISVAVVVGVTVAQPSLFLPTLLAMLVFALTNVLFTRMVFAWVDRWLSTRRAREIFTALIFVASIGVQYVNLHFNPAFQGHHRHAQATAALSYGPMLRRVAPYTAWLPPSLIASAIVSADAQHLGSCLGETAACAGFGLLFLAVYASRMRTEFRGENLSDTAIATRPAAAASSPRAAHPLPAMSVPALTRPAVSGFLPATLAPLLNKELLVLRRNVGLFYGLVAPAVMVFLFAGRMSARGSSHWLLLAAVAYALLGISPISYNSFGTEGTGAQLYFIAPVPLREVFFAKNVFTLLLALVEVVLVVGITAYVTARPSLIDVSFALLWALGTLLLNTTIGNLRSVSAPKKVVPGRAMNKAQSPVSAYIAMGILFGCAALGFGFQLLAGFLGKPWVGVLLMLAFSAGGVVVYVQGLRGITGYALERRDTLFEELGKKT